ncbi:MAG: entericidin A/B family lipoprotein [Litorivicinus sp.]
MKPIILMCVLALTGCATVEGLGKDIQRAGEKIEEAATR